MTNDQPWRVAKQRKLLVPYHTSCDNCQKILQAIEGSSMPDVYMKTDYQTTIDPYLNLVQNGPIVCKMIEDLFESSDEFRTFGEEIKERTKHLSALGKVKTMSFYEQIFIRVLYRKYGAQIDKFQDECEHTEVLESRTSPANVTIRANLGVVGVSRTTAAKAAAGDVSRELGKVIITADAEIRSFSVLLAFLHSGKASGLQERLILNYLLGKMEKMFKYTAGHPDCVVGRRNVMFNYLVTARDYLTAFDNRTGSSSMRVQIVELVGAPGLGKSESVKSMSIFLQAIVPVLPAADMVYVRSRDFWWNGYCGQPIVLYDDVCHASGKNSKVDVVSELIAIGSGTFRSPPMAFEKDTRFTSIFTFVTSNFPVATLCSSKDTVAALRRRIISGQCAAYADCAVQQDERFVYQYTGRFLSSVELHSRPLVSYFAETLAIMRENQQVEISWSGVKTSEDEEIERMLASVEDEKEEEEEAVSACAHIVEAEADSLQKESRASPRQSESEWILERLKRGDPVDPSILVRLFQL